MTDADRKHIHDVAAGWGKERGGGCAGDPPRAPRESAELASGISRCRCGVVGCRPPAPEVAPPSRTPASGVRSMMITGDHPATAPARGSRGDRVWQDGDIAMTGADLDELDQHRIRSVDRQAARGRAGTAAHKLRSSMPTRRRGIICAMTGDGATMRRGEGGRIGIPWGKPGPRSPRKTRISSWKTTTTRPSRGGRRGARDLANIRNSSTSSCRRTPGSSSWSFCPR